MNTTLCLRRDRVNRIRLLLFVSLSCALLSCACGTSPQSVNSYQQGVKAVDEEGAVRTLRTIAAAQATYAATQGNAEYGSFVQLATSGILDVRFASSSPESNGYVYTMKVTPASSGREAMYAVNADPKQQAGGVQAAGRHFYLDSTSMQIHANSTQPATPSDPTYP